MSFDTSVVKDGSDARVRFSPRIDCLNEPSRLLIGLYQEALRVFPRLTRDKGSTRLQGSSVNAMSAIMMGHGGMFTGGFTARSAAVGWGTTSYLSAVTAG